MKSLPKLYFPNKAPIEKVVKLWNLEQYEQRTQEWLDARQGCISASDVAIALLQSKASCQYYIDSFGTLEDFDFKINPKKCCNKYSKKQDLILKKCNLGKPFTGNTYTLHGQKYEQVVSNIYSQINQVDILEFGLLIHPTHPFLGASPDGITSTGRMIEIKCPPIRKVKPYPPIHYFQQMLMQLECTGLEECDYIDAHFVEYLNEKAWDLEAKKWELDNPNLKHHIYGLMSSITFDSGEVENMYPPVDVVKISQFKEWMSSAPGKITFYKLHDFYQSTTRASTEWFETNFPEMNSVWEEILYHRTNDGKEKLVEKLAKKKVSVYKPRQTKTLPSYNECLMTHLEVKIIPEIPQEIIPEIPQ